ncbi:MAG: hypothetical protein R3D57_18555 [Hyphomicrobiaceae bacterium]
MVVRRKEVFTMVAAGLLLALSGTAVPALADEAVAPPAAEATGETEALSPEAQGATSTEVAPSAGTGTVEEPSFSVMPSEGPGGGCRHRIQEPSV